MGCRIRMVPEVAGWLGLMEPSGTAVLLAAGTEHDWLDAWYTEAIHQSRTRYRRDQDGTG
jgi:hypothetical protein